MRYVGPRTSSPGSRSRARASSMSSSASGGSRRPRRSVNSANDTGTDRGWGGGLDSSAVLAWLFREPGRDVVEASLPGIISAVNLTEVVYVGVRRGLDPREVQDSLVDL